MFSPAASWEVKPCLYVALTPWKSNGLLLFINKIPFVALAPYKAEEAPGINSTLWISNSWIPSKLPAEKPKPGASLFIPSTNWTKPLL